MQRRLIDATAYLMELERIALEYDYMPEQMRQAFKALDAQPTIEQITDGKHNGNISPSCATCGLVEKLTEEIEELKAWHKPHPTCETCERMLKDIADTGEAFEGFCSRLRIYRKNTDYCNHHTALEG